MADQEKKVKFSAQDSGISSFMNKIRGDSKRIFEEQLSNAKKLTNETKDQIKFLKEYINELQRKNKIENDARRQSIAQRMQYGGEKEQISAREDQGILRGTMAGQSAQITVLKEMLSEMKKGVTPEKRQSIFQEVVKAGLFRDVTNAIGQIPGARTGLEVIPSLLGISGAGLGAALGAPLLASAAGAQLGKSAGEFVANNMVRHLTEQSRLIGAQGRLRGLGYRGDVSDLSRFGLDYSQSAAITEALLKSAGGRNIGLTESGKVRRGIDADTLMMFSKGYNLSNEDILNYTSNFRLTKSLIPLQNILGTAKLRGIASEVNFGDVLRNYTSLVQSASTTGGNVNAQAIFNTMSGFNALGGQFDVTNPNSNRLINNIAQNISGTNNPMFQAMNYQILRKLHPDKGVSDLLEIMQRPTEHPEFIKAVVEDIKARGGGKDFERINLAGRLGLGENISAAREILEGGLDFSTKQGQIRLSELEKLAQQNVSPLEVNQAKITNAFTVGMIEGISTVTSTFAKEMAVASKEAAKEFKEQFKISDSKKPRRSGASGTW